MTADATSPKSGSSESDFLSSYKPYDGVPDELLDGAGKIKSAWRPLIQYLSHISPDALSRRFLRGDQYLRDAGVFFRQYDDDTAQERDWPLSHIPVLIDEADWAQIETGLVQRAELLESVVADIYGPMNLVKEGHLPAELIASSPEWLRPMVGTTPRNGNFLKYLAFEVGRGPDGTWWVLGDRTEAPSGAGFALENRVATKQVFPNFYRHSNVQRLSGFFRHFRDHLLSLCQTSDTNVGVLTPGRLNDSYYEHAYIARYLGFMLLEGEDITVRNGETLVRTVDGLQPINVLWRRMDASFADPLELNSESIIGTPGLVDEVRSGRLSMVNCPGSGILENRFMLAFLPRICESLTGAPLALPNIATWWCGQDSQRAYVLERDDMMIGSAHATSLPFQTEDMSAPALQSGTESIKQRLMDDGTYFVGQEPVKLSTTPVVEQNAASGQPHLLARPMTIRVFMARTAHGWKAMPGGYARVGQDQGQTLLALQRGGRVADVWVVGQTPVMDEPLEETDGQEHLRKMPEALPSRVADNMFWLGRYVERAEAMARMVRAYHRRVEEIDDTESGLLKIFQDFLTGYNIAPEEGIPEALYGALSSAITSAGHLRDRYSTDGWTALKDLLDSTERLQKSSEPGSDTVDAAQTLLRKISSLSGLIHESMYHHTGWRFMRIGRAIERGANTARTLRHFTRKDVPQGALEIPVDIGDSTITHRRRYLVTTKPETVIDLLALDRYNPRSVLYQVNECKEHISFLPKDRDALQPSALSRAVLKLHTDLTIAPVKEITPKALEGVENALYDISSILSATYLS